jgi:phosphoribosylanthranilate isomerase
VSEFRPFGVDVSSGVEARPRVKDTMKMRDFVYAVRRAEGMV